MLQLIIHHDVHYLLYALINIFAANTISYGSHQTFYLLLGKSAQMATIHQHTCKVGHALCSNLVKGTLQAHRLAQVKEVTANGSHGIISKRLVVFVVGGQSCCCCGHTLMQAKASIGPNAVRFTDLAV